MESAILLVAGIQLVVLFLFFRLSGDINKIKSNLVSKDPSYWYQEYTKNSYLKRNEKALHSLQEYVWTSITKDRSRASYDKLKEKYNDRFISLGSTFPEYPF